MSRILRLSRRRGQRRRRSADYIQGSFLVISSSVFDRCHGFDERFFLYGEDADLCLRVRAAGMSIEYDPAFTITHHGGGSSAEPVKRLDHFITGCLQLYAKHRGPGKGRDWRRSSARRWPCASGGIAGGASGLPETEAGNPGDVPPPGGGRNQGRRMKAGRKARSGSVDILGTRIDALGMDDVLARACALVRARRPRRRLITANVDQLVGNRGDRRRRAIYRQAALTVPDGVPLLWAARFLRTPLPERINGTDLMERLCALAAQKGFSVFLLGGPEGCAAAAARQPAGRAFPACASRAAYFPVYGFEEKPR